MLALLVYFILSCLCLVFYELLYFIVDEILICFSFFSFTFCFYMSISKSKTHNLKKKELKHWLPRRLMSLVVMTISKRTGDMPASKDVITT